MSRVPMRPGVATFRSFSIRTVSKVSVPADALPTGVLWRNGAQTSIPVNIMELSGEKEYRAQVPVPPDAQPGDAWEILYTAVLDGQVLERWQYLGQTLFPGAELYRAFTTRDGKGRGVEPDAPPAALIARNGVLQAVSVTINNTGSPNRGNFMLSFLVNPLWVAGDSISAAILAQIDGITTVKTVDLGRLVEVNDLAVNRLRVVPDSTPVAAVNDSGQIVLVNDRRPIVVNDN